ncbi:MAG: PKD domain-containing protein [Bacteroidetes bacterium]|nr:PKD domain-containing protein [Bacteroidota bacterium]
MKKILFSLFCLIFLTFYSFAQQKEANVWMFGKYLGMDFNTIPPSAIITSAMLTFEGCATISDSDGNLLFYTDGTTVWNKNNTEMLNGTGLGGHMSSTQSGIIVPRPQYANLYYIFTVPYQGDPVGLQYSVVDMNEGGGLGKVTEKNVQLVTPVVEKVTAMKASNNEDIWVITHKWRWLEIVGQDTTEHPSNEFVAYKVTAANGVDTANKVVSAVGRYHGGNRYNTQGYLKGAPDGQKLALAVEFDGYYQLFDFNNETGVVSNPITLGSFTKAYGVEFSPNSRYLYITEASLDTLTIMRIFQFNAYAGDSASIVNSKVRIGTATVASTASDGRGALQVGPNQKIYVSRYDFGKLGVINNPNIGGVECHFINDGITLWEGTAHVCRMGLPTFIQSYFAPPSFTYSNICYGDSTQFTIISSLEGVESVTWNFGDGNQSPAWNPKHKYALPGEYVVSLILQYATTNNTAEETVEILTAPVAKFTYIPYCFGAPTQFNDNSNPVAGTVVEWQWNFGDGGTATTKNPQHTFTTQGVHNVSLLVTTNNGCEGDTIQTINQIQPPSAPETPTGPAEICQNSDNKQYQTNSTPGAVSYQWAIAPVTAGTISGTTTSATVDWTSAFSGTASITVAGINTCGEPGNASSPLQVTVNALPIVNAGTDINLLYNTTTIFGEATASGSPPLQYAWEPHDSLVVANIPRPTTIALKASTLFELTVTDDNSCVDSDEILVHIYGGPLGANAYAEPNTICFGDSSQLSCLPSGGSENYTFSWTSIPPGFATNTQNPKVWPSITTTYTVIIYDGYNQVNKTVTVTVKPLPIVNAGTDWLIPYGTATPLIGTVTGSNGPPYGYHWEPTAFIAGWPNVPGPYTTNLYAPQVFVLKGEDGFGCINYDTVVVNLSGGPLGANPYSADTAVCRGDSTLLIAFPYGGNEGYYTISWSPAQDVHSPNSDTTWTKPLSDTTTYTVTVHDGYNTVQESRTVIMFPLPYIDLVPEGVTVINEDRDTVIACVYDTLFLYAGNPGFDYIWSDFSTDDSLRIHTTGIGTAIQTHWVTVTNPVTYCSNTDTITIIFAFNECTGIDDQPDNSSVTCYPNPTSGMLYIVMNNISGNFRISVLDLNGQVVTKEETLSITKNTYTKKIDLSALQQGIYLLHIVNDRTVMNHKIIKQ